MKPEYDKNNKEEVPFSHYLEIYRNLDPHEVSERTGIPYQEEQKAFQVRFMERPYLVTWPDFAVTKISGDSDYSALTEDIPAKILLIRFLDKGNAAAGSGAYLTYREVPWGEFYFKPFQGRCLMRLAYGYAKKQDRFAALMDQLGAQRLASGDISYRFELLNNFYMQFILWDGDDEFPPSAQILYSDNFPLSFEAEDLAVAGDISIGTLKKMEKELYK